jgi:tetratricopeptide (TPR) repeat protein
VTRHVVTSILVLSLGVACRDEDGPPPRFTPEPEQALKLFGECQRAAAQAQAGALHHENPEAIQGAMRSCTRALQLGLDDDSFVQSNLYLGQILYALKQYDQALGLLRVAVSLDSRNPVTRFQLGEALFAAGQGRDHRGQGDTAGPFFQEAVLHLEAAAAEDPGIPTLFPLLVLCLEHLGREEEKIEALQRDVEIHPADVYRGFRLAWALNSLGRYDESLVVLDKVNHLVSGSDWERSITALGEASQNGERYELWSFGENERWER